MSDQEITYIRVAGRDVDAALAVCPFCEVLDIGTTFDPNDRAGWRATCSEGHSWVFAPTELHGRRS